MIARRKKPTKAASEHMGRVKEMGCIACWLEHHRYAPAQYHHIVEGGKRLGDFYGLPLCPWHHEGEKMGNTAISRMRHEFGPSLKLHKRDFVERYGTERELLQRVMERLGT